MRPPIGVFLVDDHDLVREGLGRVLATEPGVEVVGEASTAAQALRRIPLVAPDVAVVDVHLPDGDGVLLCRELRAALPDLACLILTADPDEDTLLDAVVGGASGYLIKDVRGVELVRAIRDVAAGEVLLDPAAVQRVRNSAGTDGEWDPRLASLTMRERRVLELIADGRTNREISGELGITEKSVKNHVTSILAKTSLRHRTEAAVWMRRRTELRDKRGDRAWVRDALEQWGEPGSGNR